MGRLSGIRRVLTPVSLVLLMGTGGHAQTVEVAPFGGYRFGGSFAEVPGGTVVDDDGGRSFGVVLDVVLGPAADGVKLEGVYSREEANIRVRSGMFEPITTVTAVVEQLMIGGIRDLDDGRARPFLSGLLGVTRYAVPGDSEIRFAIGVGAGMKAYLTRHVGLRLDARGYMTIVQLGGAGVCGGFGCAIRFDVNPAFQGDLTAGLLIAF